MASFWNFNTNEINTWCHQLTPGIPNTGGMLFPKKLNGDAGPSNNCHEEYRSKLAVGNTLVANLLRALSSASTYNTNNNVAAVVRSSNGEPIPQRPRIEESSAGDLYQILDPTFAKSNSEGNNSSELSTGAILSRMTLGGLVNGMAGVTGGVVDTLTCIPLGELQMNGNMDEATKKEEWKKLMEVVIPTAGNLQLKEVILLARGLHRSIAAR